jgi:hypothetical protein
MDSTGSPRTAKVLRWTSRLTSLASLGILTLFLIAEQFDPSALAARDWLLAVFFPFGVALGLILGWRREFLGGIVALIGLVGFYLVHLAVSGQFPRGWAFAVLAGPAFLLLLSAAAHRIHSNG